MSAQTYTMPDGTAIDVEPSSAYQCAACDSISPEVGPPLYDCANCHTIFNQTQSSNGRNRCPQCNRFATQIAKESCASCQVGQVAKVALLTCQTCEPPMTLLAIDLPDHASAVHGPDVTVIIDDLSGKFATVVGRAANPTLPPAADALLEEFHAERDSAPPPPKRPDLRHRPDYPPSLAPKGVELPYPGLYYALATPLHYSDTDTDGALHDNAPIACVSPVIAVTRLADTPAGIAYAVRCLDHNYEAPALLSDFGEADHTLRYYARWALHWDGSGTNPCVGPFIVERAHGVPYHHLHVRCVQHGRSYTGTVNVSRIDRDE